MSAERLLAVVHACQLERLFTLRSRTPNCEGRTRLIAAAPHKSAKWPVRRKADLAPHTGQDRPPNGPREQHHQIGKCACRPGCRPGRHGWPKVRGTCGALAPCSGPLSHPVEKGLVAGENLRRPPYPVTWSGLRCPLKIDVRKLNLQVKVLLVE